VLLCSPISSVSTILRDGEILPTHTSDALPERAHEGVVRHKVACKVHMSMGIAAYRRNESHGLDHCRGQLVEKAGSKEKSPPGNTTTFGTGIDLSA
jgi:hypothetical protein